MIGDKFGDGGDEDKDEHGNDAVECDDCDGFDNCGNEDVHGDTYDLIEVAVVLITVMIVLLAVLLLVSALVMTMVTMMVMMMVMMRSRWVTAIVMVRSMKGSSDVGEGEGFLLEYGGDDDNDVDHDDNEG